LRPIFYADLTWPDIAALPRHLPVLIPLGLGDYDLTAASQGLNADQAILLPAVPYGFESAHDDPLGQIAVRPGLLRRVLVGIGREFRAQGFRRIVFLNGQGDQGLAGGVDLLDVPSGPRPWPAWPADLGQRVVVISTGHTEQHGYHLPLCTDTLIVQAIADGLAARASKDVWCLPAWPYGVSTHTHEFPGTLNLGSRVFEDFFLAIVDRLARLGAETILFSNGHGGELETSYVLHLRPDLVSMDRATTETDFVTTANYAMDWVESGRLIANPPWSDDTESGLYGDGRMGTADKGRRWLEAAIEEKLETVREIREQHTLRQAKRARRAATAGLGG
jgi:creatinine amidohydrolase